MIRELIIGIVDVMVQIAAILILLWCAMNVYSALKSQHLFYNSKKVTRVDEPVGFWIAIMSLIVVMVVFGVLVYRGFGG